MQPSSCVCFVRSTGRTNSENYDTINSSLYCRYPLYAIKLFFIDTELNPHAGFHPLWTETVHCFAGKDCFLHMDGGVFLPISQTVAWRHCPPESYFLSYQMVLPYTTIFPEIRCGSGNRRSSRLVSSSASEINRQLAKPQFGRIISADP